MNIIDLVETGVDRRASDIHVTVGVAPTLRIDGQLVKLEMDKLMPDQTKELVFSTLNENQKNILETQGEIDFSYSTPGLGRFRVNAYKQRGSYGMALRIIPLEIPSMESLLLPPVLSELARLPRGLILVTGPTGSGKSTTLASMIDQINKERNCHILTLEDPIEYVHRHQNSIVNQREIGSDSHNFSNALRAALRQDPDVILVGEMRDLETISIAITAAETGHLVLSTLHTIGAAKTIDRIIDVFPPHQQDQVRVQLASVIQSVISQQLLPRMDGTGRIGAYEVMTRTSAISNLIREGKIHQIDSAIQTGAGSKMQTMDNSLLGLYRKGLISKDIVVNQAVDKAYVKKYIV